MESFIDSWEGKPPSRLVLDIDSTDDEVHGCQEGRFFHSYYGHYCFLPLYITCGGRPLFAQLRPGNADPARGVTGPLGRIIARLRQEWPWLKILLRADSAYARGELSAWCEDNGVQCVIGLAKNSRLAGRIGWELADAQAKAQRRGHPARRYTEFRYATLTSWSRQRRVVAKAEYLPGKANPRFVVTSLPADTFSARTVYERVSCPRGNMENTIEEQQLDLFSDRTSASRFAANQLRLLFSAFASILFSALRHALHRHPPGPGHRRNVAAQAPQDRRPRHGLGAKGQGGHGLRAPICRRLRTGPRPIARGISHPLRTSSEATSSDRCAPAPIEPLHPAAVHRRASPFATASPPHCSLPCRPASPRLQSCHPGPIPAPCERCGLVPETGANEVARNLLVRAQDRPPPPRIPRR